MNNIFFYFHPPQAIRLLPLDYRKLDGHYFPESCSQRVPGADRTHPGRCTREHEVPRVKGEVAGDVRDKVRDREDHVRSVTILACFLVNLQNGMERERERERERDII